MFTRLGACLWVRLLPLFLFLLILLSPALAREKTDVVVMKNGDRITCEIRSLEHGQLVIKPPYSTATLAIDWEEVELIESDQLFQVILTDGNRMNGSIQQVALPDPSLATESFIVEGPDERFSNSHTDVLSIEQLEGSFWKQLDFDIDFGFSLLKANSERQTTLNTSLSRLSRKNLIQMSASAYLTRRADAEDITRNNGKITYLRLRENRWFVGGLTDFLRNNEQQLDLRVTAGGIGGKRVISKPSHAWDVYTGLVINSEQFSDQTVRNNTEMIIGTTALWYQFDSTQFETQVQLFPSLNDGGRYRIDINSSAYLDLWNDLYFRVTFYQNFDSRPPAGASGNDYGVTTSFGWDF